MSSFHSRTATWTFRTARQLGGQPRQLVVVRREAGPSPRAALVEVLGHRPARSRGRRRSTCPADLVEEDEAPRPVACRRMAAVSVISTRNVLWPRARLSWAPMRGEDAVHHARSARSGPARSCPTWARSTMSAACRMYVDFPAMFGPVMRRHSTSPDARWTIVRHEPRARRSSSSSTGCRPSWMSMTPPSSTDRAGRSRARAPRGRSDAQHVERRHRLGGSGAGARPPRRRSGRSSSDSSYSSRLHPALGAQDLGLLLPELRRHVALGADQGLAPRRSRPAASAPGSSGSRSRSRTPGCSAPGGIAMPVRSRSRPSSPAIQARASRTSRRSSPSAGFHDSRIKPPSWSAEGGSSTSAASSVFRRPARSSTASAHWRISGSGSARRAPAAPGSSRASPGRRRGRAASPRRGRRGWPGGRGRRCPRAPGGDRRGAPAPPPGRATASSRCPISGGRRSGRRSHWRSETPAHRRAGAVHRREERRRATAVLQALRPARGCAPRPRRG